MRDAVRMLRELRVPFALIGAHAVAMNVKEHRSTDDIDVVAPSEHMPLVRQRSVEFGFIEQPKDAEAMVRTFRHRSGGRLDIIFDDSGGFANLDAVQMVDLSGVGEIPVAAPLDIAYAKLRTQRRDWVRQEEKRVVDFADLVSMLRENPELARDLDERISLPARTDAKESPHLIDMVIKLREACIQAGIAPPRSKTRTHVLVLAVLVVLLAVSAIVWITWVLSRSS